MTGSCIVTGGARGITVGYVELNGVSLTDAMDYLSAKTRRIFWRPVGTTPRRVRS